MIPPTNLFNMNELNIKNMSSEDLMYAGPEPEFYYIVNGKETDLVVPEGEPIGIDVDTEEGVILELFNNIYWAQYQYEEE